MSRQVQAQRHGRAGAGATATQPRHSYDHHNHHNHQHSGQPPFRGQQQHIPFIAQWRGRTRPLLMEPMLSVNNLKPIKSSPLAVAAAPLLLYPSWWGHEEHRPPLAAVHLNAQQPATTATTKTDAGRASLSRPPAAGTKTKADAAHSHRLDSGLDSGLASLEQHTFRIANPSRLPPAEAWDPKRLVDEATQTDRAKQAVLVSAATQTSSRRSLPASVQPSPFTKPGTRSSMAYRAPQSPSPSPLAASQNSSPSPTRRSSTYAGRPVTPSMSIITSLRHAKQQHHHHRQSASRSVHKRRQSPSLDRGSLRRLHQATPASAHTPGGPVPPPVAFEIPIHSMSASVSRSRSQSPSRSQSRSRSRTQSQSPQRQQPRQPASGTPSRIFGLDQFSFRDHSTATTTTTASASALADTGRAGVGESDQYADDELSSQRQSRHRPTSRSSHPHHASSSRILDSTHKARSASRDRGTSRGSSKSPSRLASRSPDRSHTGILNKSSRSMGGVSFASHAFIPGNAPTRLHAALHRRSGDRHLMDVVDSFLGSSFIDCLDLTRLDDTTTTTETTASTLESGSVSTRDKSFGIGRVTRSYV
ncbi:hypothetical protein BC831DRAFT_475940 [Entophlyctis helioformis]|nr:hypothetical protein BC831DRAFT_475940 [Entophlyctis helioformis]